MKSYEYEKFYKELEKPVFSPPSWIFAPVWTAIYLLLFLSLFLVLVAPQHPLKGMAYTLFALQMILNLAWTPVFFKKHKICTAFLICITLVVSICSMIIVFLPISHFAALLLTPYLFWVMFATVLNLYLCKLN